MAMDTPDPAPTPAPEAPSPDETLALAYRGMAEHFGLIADHCAHLADRFDQVTRRSPKPRG